MPIISGGKASAIGGPLLAWGASVANPCWPAATFTGAASLFGTFADVWFDGATFHAFATVDGTTPGIYHGTSPTGLPGSWTFDASPCLTTGATYDATSVGVATVFNVGTTLHMYYGAVGGGNRTIAHATTSTTTPGSGWTKDGGNPLIDGTGAPLGLHNNIEPGPGRCIRVGSTYYLWVSSIASTTERSCTVYTASAAGGPWTLLAGTYGTTFPIFRNGRFGNSVWTDGDLFYSLMGHYRINKTPVATAAEVELWAAPEPTFQPGTRWNLGVLRQPSTLLPTWEQAQLDTPLVICDDVTRSSFACTGGNPLIYYAGEDVSGNWLTGALLPDTAVRMPQANPLPYAAVGPWLTTTLTASQTNVQQTLLGGTLQYIAPPFSCSVMGVALSMGATGHLTAGSCSATLTLGTSRTNFARTLTATLSTVNAAFASAGAVEGEFPYNPGDLIGVQLTTSGTFAATATEIDFMVYLLPR